MLSFYGIDDRRISSALRGTSSESEALLRVQREQQALHEEMQRLSAELTREQNE